jgi:uncharacterized protein (TIGR02597 family)
MRNMILPLAAACLLTVSLPGVNKADSVGFNKTTVPANSDAIVSVPFARKSVGTFTSTGTTGTGVVIAGALATNAYQNAFYIRVTSGAAKGRWSTVSANNATEFTLADTSFIPSLGAGTTFEVIPHQTLGNVFSDELKGVSYVASLDPDLRIMEVLMPNTTSTGINKASAGTFFYFDNAWRKLGLEDNFNGQILPPDTYFTIRNKTNKPLTFVTSGLSLTNTAQARSIATGGVKNDIPAVSGNPTAVTLLDLNLGGTAAFATSLDPELRKDELLVYTNGASGINRAASAVYYFFNGAWRKVENSPDPDNPLDRSSDVIPAGAALIIRKATGAPGSNAWTQDSK